MNRSRISTLLFFFIAITLFDAHAQSGGKSLAENWVIPRFEASHVHADDVGVTHSVNAATIKALDTGLVNSASLMVPCPWFPEIADYAKSHPAVDFGLHLTLTSERVSYRWSPVASNDKVPSLVDENGYSITTGPPPPGSIPKRSSWSFARKLTAPTPWAFAPPS